MLKYTHLCMGFSLQNTRFLAVLPHFQLKHPGTKVCTLYGWPYSWIPCVNIPCSLSHFAEQSINCSRILLPSSSGFGSRNSIASTRSMLPSGISSCPLFRSFAFPLRLLLRELLAICGDGISGFFFPFSSSYSPSFKPSGFSSWTALTVASDSSFCSLSNLGCSYIVLTPGSSFGICSPSSCGSRRSDSICSSDPSWSMNLTLLSGSGHAHLHNDENILFCCSGLVLKTLSPDFFRRTSPRIIVYDIWYIVHTSAESKSCTGN